jgi:hypothetical protein
LAQQGHRDAPAARGTSLHLRLWVSQNTERPSASWAAVVDAAAAVGVVAVARAMAMLFRQLLQKMLVNLLYKLN